MRRSARPAIAIAAASFFMTCTVSAQVHARSQFDLPSQPLADALRAVGTQANINILFDPPLTAGHMAPALNAQVTPGEALERLLVGTGLRLEFLNDRTVLVVSRRVGPGATVSAAPAAGKAQANGLELGSGAAGTQAGFWQRFRLAHNDSSALESDSSVRATNSQSSSAGQESSSESSRESERLEKSQANLPEILVRGSRSLNADIARSEDDIQPYVVFGREEIERSQAPDLETFFKSKLTMNTALFTLEQRATAPHDGVGAINLRGLGTKQTLILVDGRRVPGVTLGGGSIDIFQPDITGIPLSSIERIEVLPATASAIYGGGATGGVINIIRKRDYRGFEVSAQYSGDFARDSTATRFNANGGMSLPGGATSVSFSASHSKATPLSVVERDFGRQSRDLALANGVSPLGGFAPVLGERPNVCAVFGLNQFGRGSCNPDAQLVLDDGTPVGSSVTSVPEGYAGPASDGGQALIGNAGTYNLGIPDSGQYLLRTPTTSSGLVSLRHEFGEAVEAFIDLSSSRTESDLSTSGGAEGFQAFLPADHPANPFQQAIAVTRIVPDFHRPSVSVSKAFQGSAGIVWRLPIDWAVNLEHAKGWSKYSHSNPQGDLVSQEGVALLDSSLLQDLTAHPIDLDPHRVEPTAFFTGGPYETSQDTTTLRLSGPTLSLPAGPINVSALLEQRKEVAENSFADDDLKFSGGVPRPDLRTIWFPERTQKVRSYYLETSLPLFSAANSTRLARELEIQLAARRDEYRLRSVDAFLEGPSRDGPFEEPEYFTTEGSGTGYLLGARYAPVSHLAFRASVATGFLPASLSQVVPFFDTRTIIVPAPTDPRRGNTPMSVPRDHISGGNPDIEPEDSETVSAGLILTPTGIPGFRFSVDYTRIEKRGEIFSPTQAFILANEDVFPDRVVRGPNLPGDPAGWAGPLTSIDSSLINISSALVEAIDLQFDYTREWPRVGTFHLSAVGTVMNGLERQLLPESENYDSVGFADGPLEHKGNASLAWQRGSWGATLSTQYYGSYSILFANPNARNNNEERLANQGSEKIESQVYHDLFVTYRSADSESRLMKGLEISVGIQNILNQSPPILAVDGLDGYVFSSYSYYGDPRLRSFSLTVKKRFEN